ncbi:MAG TPA: hypothetical protein VIS51_04665 [Solirubrobacterales bacterium]
MFDRRQTLRELIRTQHREFTLYLEKRDEEFREEFRRRDEEFREFNREILLRNEKVYTTVIAEMEESRKQLAEGTKQIQANTRAVLSVLDRLDEAA